MSPRYDVPKAAPEPLRLVQQFVNTIDLEHEREWLGSPRELRAWLEARGLPEGGRIGAAELERVRDVREALRALLAAHNGAPVTASSLAVLNEALRRARLTLQLDDDGAPRLVTLGRGVDRALGEILAAALAGAEAGAWSRLKACRQCRWIFYDYSRNRSATWCSMSICGNRRKTRAYRRRRAASA